MILRIHNWLKSNTIINILLVIGYYLLVVLPHEEVGIWIAKTLDQPYGRDTYNLIVLVLGLASILGYLGILWNGAKQLNTGKKRLWISFALTLLFIIISFNVLLVVNVEIIHFVQYAFLALLLFPLLNNYRDTLFYATILAVIDEGYQYFYLAPLRTDYFDFNDIIIDLIGAAMGLFLYWASGIRSIKSERKWFQTATFIGFAVLTTVTIIAYLSGQLAVYPVEGGTNPPILLIRKIQESFWTIIHPNVKFHVVQPLEGLLILGGLFYFYTQQVFVMETENK